MSWGVADGPLCTNNTTRASRMGWTSHYWLKFMWKKKNHPPMPFAHRYCPCQVPSFQFGPCHPHTSSLLIFSETWIDQSFPSSLSTTPWHLAQHTSHPNETLLELPDCISETSPPPFMDSIQRSELAPTQNSKSWLSRRVTYHPTYPSCKGWT